MENERVLEYSNYAQVLSLIDILPESNIELDMMFRVTAPERFWNLRKAVMSGPAELEEKVSAFHDYVEMAGQLNVFPFTRLQWTPGLPPQIEHVLPDFMEELSSEDINQYGLSNPRVHPLNVMRGWKYHSIIFEDATSPEEIQELKKTASELSPRRYSVVGVRADLNGYYNSNGFRGPENSARIRLEDGTVSVKGEKIDDIVKGLIGLGFKEIPEPAETP